MSLIRSYSLWWFALVLLALGACSDGDYQGGGRRNDVGRSTNDGISLAAGGEQNAGGGAGKGGAAAAGQAGLAGCSASGDGGQGLGVGVCTQ